MTKEAGFLETIVKETKTVSGSKATSTNNEVKTAPSLFDSMLGEAKIESTNQNETTVTANQSNTASDVSVESKINEKSTDKNNVKEEIPSNSNTNKSTTAKVEVSNKVPSLLDKLIQEATQQVSNQVVDENTQLKETQNNIDVKVKTDITLKQNTQSTEQLTTTETKSAVNNKEQNSGSLLDKLMQEVNTQIKEESQATVKIQNDMAKSDSPTITNASEKNQTNDLIADETKKTVTTKTENTQVNIILAETAEVVTATDETNITNTPSPKQNAGETLSLLDKLIQEANVQIENSNDKKVEEKNVEVKNTVQVEVIKTEQIKAVNVAKEDNALLQTKEVVLKEVAQQDSKIVTVQTQVTKEQVSVPPISNINEKVANELAKISDNNNVKINVTQEQINNAKPQNEIVESNIKETPKSLMDQLLDETKLSLETQENTKKAQVTASINSSKMPTEPILTNIYLSSLNKASQDALLEKTHEGKTIIANATSINDVRKGADLLNLGLQSSEVIVEEEQFKENVKNEFLNKLSVTRDIIKHDITKMNEEIVSQSKAVKSEAAAIVANNVTATSKLPEVEVNISSTAAYNIENRIIGARQHMNSMMSDVARNMYLNYKPPVTAFRMNLNPGNLGSIAVLIKSDKESGLSISLNMSNVATLDSFVDNQAALRAALAKNFNANTNINLEFNMQDGQQQGNSNQQNKKQQQQNHRATNDILESLTNNSESTSKVTNYM